jgi:hypothetical protein
MALGLLSSGISPKEKSKFFSVKEASAMFPDLNLARGVNRDEGLC